MTSSELKHFSQRKLSGKYGVTIAVTLTVFVSNLLLSMIVQWLVPPDSVALFFAYTVVVFLVDLLFGLLVSGRTYLYMNILYDREVSFADLKQGFLEHPEKAMFLQLPFALAGSLATTPVEFYQIFYYNRQQADRNMLFLCMLIGTAGIIVSVILELVFSQVFYLLHDFPEKAVPDLFRASAKLMRGHKGQYFLLLLSYVPWLMLSAMLFFIPALFIISQMYAAQTAFYQNLTGRK
ncbi:MAG: DUF975 family protein [Lachnospiraceae bacterium]|nr:DUF975 family protein [Lachnospiraceae bacterium]